MWLRPGKASFFQPSRALPRLPSRPKWWGSPTERGWGAGSQKRKQKECHHSRYTVHIMKSSKQPITKEKFLNLKSLSISSLYEFLHSPSLSICECIHPQNILKQVKIITSFITWSLGGNTFSSPITQIPQLRYNCFSSRSIHGYSVSREVIDVWQQLKKGGGLQFSSKY